MSKDFKIHYYYINHNKAKYSTWMRKGVREKYTGISGSGHHKKQKNNKKMKDWKTQGRDK